SMLLEILEAEGYEMSRTMIVGNHTFGHGPKGDGPCAGAFAGFDLGRAVRPGHAAGIAGGPAAGDDAPGVVGFEEHQRAGAPDSDGAKPHRTATGVAGGAATAARGVAPAGKDGARAREPVAGELRRVGAD